MLLTTAVYVPNCLLVVVTSDDPVLPDWTGAARVEATETSLFVGTEYAAATDDIQLSLTDEPDVDESRTPFLLYEGEMRAERGEIRLDSVDDDRFIAMRAPADRIRVRVWGDYPELPEAVVVQAVAATLEASSRDPR
jgi:hypothetical protein